MTTFETPGTRSVVRRKRLAESSDSPLRRSSDSSAVALDAPAPPPDARDVLNSINAVLYDWDMLTDRLSWGANVGEVLSAFPASALASGGAFAELVTATSETSRFQAIKGSAAVDKGEGAPYRALYSLLRRDGAKIAVEDIGRWFADGAGRPVRAHGVVRIVAGPGQPGGSAFSASKRDPLTGAYNRRHLVEHLNAACADVARRRSQLAVLVLGVERLPEINQRYGYDAADAAIVGVARRVAGNVRETDMLARYLGGKFVFVLDGGDAEQARTAARRMLRVVSSEPVATPAGPIEVSLRIGAALAPEHGRGAQALLQRAEEAYDLACKTGADRCLLFAPNVAPDHARAQLHAVSDEIVGALSERRIVLAYQPVVPAAPGRNPFFEALVRLRRRDGEIIGPEVILPIAEKVGLIAQIDQRVLELALQRIVAEPDLRLSVNVSAATLHDAGWIDRFAQALAPHPGAAGRLMIEITETVAIADIALTAQIFGRMKRVGAKIAMDDFGAGHTSFRSLRGLGVDVVKIDGAFVQNIARSADDRFFVRTLVELARHLNVETVAEWVEDAESTRILTEWGVDYLQGYHFGRAEIPAPPGDAPILAVAGR
ncbi:MAG: putative bifunctional diguanylate cyclase/phosphodiesterase [Roseiarcus sp.]